MIIEKDWQKYWLPDDLATNPNLTVQDLMAELIPYDLYVLQQEANTLQNQIAEIEAAPDYIQVPNPEKDRLPELQQQLDALLQQIAAYGNNN